MSAQAKRFEYAVRLDRAGRVSVEGAAPLELEEAWTPDDLLLAALARCTVESLRYHAQRAGADVVAEGSASGVVTKREEDGRYAFVEIDVELEADVDPVPAGVLPDLVAKAERDCFVGATLAVTPRYRWRVNGDDVTASAEPS